MSLCLIFSAKAAGAQETQQTSPHSAASFWQAAGGIVVTNWIPWAYNWYVQKWPWANVGVETWGHNLRQGFTWDNDSFFDNQLLHPYHGAMYHHSARSAGYGFWSSFPFVAAGSATWELFGENIQASFNDLINTTVGGMALGEVTYRLSALLRSGRGGGRPGLGRQLGAFVASPLAGTHALFDGAPDDVQPRLSSARAPARFAAGSHAGRGFVEMDMQYGSPFGSDFARPYDAFDFRLRLSPGSGAIIQDVGISGLLARRGLSQSRYGQLLFGVFQHYDYHQVPGINTSGSSVSAALLYQHTLNQRHRVSLGAHAEGLLLGSISSDQGYYWRRDYDLGPGAGARLTAAFSRDGRDCLQLEGRLLWLHSVHGSDANHLMSFIRAGAALPIVGTLGVGGEVTLTNRHSRYRDFPAVSKRVPEVRAFVSWLP
jgi:hypothetical protein